MKVTLWGTRGSLPNAGPETMRYGGNTSCVEVCGSDGTLLVLDAGTGIRRLGASLNGNGGRRVDVLLTHLHMDHIVGLGFFEPLYQEGREVHIWGPPSPMLDMQQRLARYLSPPLFPVRIRDLPCKLTLHDIEPGALSIGGFAITVDLVCHPGPTAGYRIAENGTTLTYMPDHEPALGSHAFPRDPDWTSGYALARDATMLIHDTQYSAAEYPEHIGWGHSSIEHALAFTRMAGARRLVTFHHDPAHDDATLDWMMQQAGTNGDLPFELVPGTEGTTFEL